MKLIVGLGNPGKEFEKTYHNLGFMCIDRLAKKLGVSINKGKFNSLFVQTSLGSEIVLLVKPLTYMNLSGDAVRSFLNYFDLTNDDVIVVCDDVDLPKGSFRFRQKGSGGTHNGLKNIVYRLGTEDFKRVRIGAGRKNVEEQKNVEFDLKDYVLSKIDEESMAEISCALDEAVEKIVGLIDGQISFKD